MKLVTIIKCPIVYEYLKGNFCSCIQMFKQPTGISNYVKMLPGI